MAAVSSTGARRPVQIAVGVVALCGLALIPLALSQNSTGHDSWIAHSPLGLRLAQIIPQFLIGTGAPGAHALKFARDGGWRSPRWRCWRSGRGLDERRAGAAGRRRWRSPASSSAWCSSPPAATR